MSSTTSPSTTAAAIKAAPPGEFPSPARPPRANAPAKAVAASSVPPGAVEAAEVEALLALSDERDRWLARVIDAHRAGFEAGRAEPGGYLDGYDLGFDHGFGARQDARAFIRGIIEGYSAGLAERHRWVSKLLGRAERPGSGGPCPLCGEYPRPRRAAAVARVRPQDRGEEKHGQTPARAVAS